MNQTSIFITALSMQYPKLNVHKDNIILAEGNTKLELPNKGRKLPDRIIIFGEIELKVCSFNIEVR